MTISRALRTIVPVGCATLGMAITGAALAQTRPGHAKIEEVVVTAQRRAEVLEKVPQSIAVISPATLRQSGVVNIHDLNQLVAGASVNFAGCCSQPTIRGISTLTTGVGFENNIAIYVDGFYVPDNISVNGDLANISSIEVLKGPQGALWGRNATGGAILINTAVPAKKLTGDLELGYGRFNEATTKAYLSGPLTDKLRFSIAEASRTTNGYNTDLGTDGQVLSRKLTPLKQITLRTKLLYQVTDWLTATAAYNYSDSSDARSELFQYYDHIPALYCIFQCYPTSQLGRATGPYTASPNEQPRAEAYLNEATFKLVANTEFGDLTSATGYAHRHTVLDFDFDESQYPLLDERGKYSQNTFQQSLNYNINAIKNLDLVVGGEFLHDTQRLTGGTPTTSVGPLNDLTSFVFQDEQWKKIDKSFAFYFDGNYHLLPWLALDVGGRYSHDNVNVLSGATGIVAFPFTAANVTYTDFTPRASLRAEVAPHTDVYFTYSQGYRSGGFNPVPPLQTTPFSPEKIKSYEIGFKTQQSWIQYDTAAFYYDYNNLQVGVTVLSDGGKNVTNETLNARFARVYGWEQNVTVHPVENATIRAGIELLHARYVDFNNYSGIGLTDGQDVPETQSLNGKRLIRAPDISGFVGADYDFQNVFGGDLDTSANLTFTSKAPTENASLFGAGDPAQADQERYVDPAYAILNLSATWKNDNGHYMVTVYGRNVTNTRYLILNGGTAGFGDFRAFSEPAVYGFRVGYSF